MSVAELEDIKKYAHKSHQTQSEFIRSAIRDKIRVVDAQDQDLKRPQEIPDYLLRLEELKKIREALDKMGSEEKTD